MRPLLSALLALSLLAACTPAASIEPTASPAPTLAAPAATATRPAPTPTQPAATETPAPATPTLLPAASPTAAAFFTHHGRIVAHGPPGTWDGRFTDPGAVLVDDGVFHMFRNGFQQWPAEVQIGHVTSPDGLTWTQQGEEPVFYSADVPYAGLAALASSALVEPDGTWVMYFYTWESTGSRAAARIGRATAPGPDGPWVADPAPVLEPGPQGAWDSQQVLAPHVLEGDDGYVMYYSGFDNRRQQIGRATSPDGVNWTKYDDPTTTDEAFAQSDPVFSPDPAGWDTGGVHQPRVLPADDGWVMFYRGLPAGNPAGSGIGYAFSPDGLQWTRAAATPVLQAREVPPARNFWFTNALYEAGTYYLFWELDASGATDIHLATRSEPLPP